MHLLRYSSWRTLLLQSATSNARQAHRRFGSTLSSIFMCVEHALCVASSTQIWPEWPYAAQFQLSTSSARLASTLDLLHAVRHCNQRSFAGPLDPICCHLPPMRTDISGRGWPASFLPRIAQRWRPAKTHHPRLLLDAPCAGTSLISSRVTGGPKLVLPLVLKQLTNSKEPAQEC